ncbi:MAG: T9SS type A sorting domain-containing protein, partial [Bacteroidales bacterium]|nr:T9SS type A sorting domain-containing protein [Bacteroidales bacterium]
TLTVMGANGQVFQRQTVQGEAGSNSLDLNASNWAAGVYYYTMEYCGQRITRKMNIAR